MGYELIVDLVANAAFTCFGQPQLGKLIDVAYETSSVDDGYPIVNTTTCALGSVVSPTSQTFSQTDSGTFECAFTCAGADGPGVTITYELSQTEG